MEYLPLGEKENGHVQREMEVHIPYMESIWDTAYTREV